MHWAELLCFTQPCHIVLWVSGVWLDGCLKKWTQYCLHVPSLLWFTSTHQNYAFNWKTRKKFKRRMSFDPSCNCCCFTNIILHSSKTWHWDKMQNVGVKSLGGDLFEFGRWWTWNVNHTRVVQFKMLLACNFFNSLEFLNFETFSLWIYEHNSEIMQRIKRIMLNLKISDLCIGAARYKKKRKKNMFFSDILRLWLHLFS